MLQSLGLQHQYDTIGLRYDAYVSYYSTG